MSRRLLSPRDLAAAIGASESSIRRWVDGGQIATSRTGGGHRRIALEEAVRYIRDARATVVRPDALGLDLPPTPRAGTLALPDEDKLYEALRAGGRGLPALFDGPVRAAMHRMGELWRHDARGILVEHRATAICLGALAELRALLPVPAEHAPIALGAAAPGDPYLIPTTMAGAVLADAGFHEVNFGSDTPIDLLAEEAVARGARLVWVSVSLSELVPPVRAAVRKLARTAEGHGIDVVVGGRCVASFKLRAGGNLTLVNSMTELAAFARRLRRPRRAVLAK